MRGSSDRDATPCGKRRHGCFPAFSVGSAPRPTTRETRDRLASSRFSEPETRNGERGRLGPTERPSNRHGALRCATKRSSRSPTGASLPSLSPPSQSRSSTDAGSLPQRRGTRNEGGGTVGRCDRSVSAEAVPSSLSEMIGARKTNVGVVSAPIDDYRAARTKPRGLLEGQVRVIGKTKRGARVEGERVRKSRGHGV